MKPSTRVRAPRRGYRGVDGSRMASATRSLYARCHVRKFGSVIFSLKTLKRLQGLRAAFLAVCFFLAVVILAEILSALIRDYMLHAMGIGSP